VSASPTPLKILRLMILRSLWRFGVEPLAGYSFATNRIQPCPDLFSVRNTISALAGRLSLVGLSFLVLEFSLPSGVLVFFLPLYPVLRSSRATVLCNRGSSCLRGKGTAWQQDFLSTRLTTIRLQNPSPPIPSSELPSEMPDLCCCMAPRLGFGINTRMTGCNLTGVRKGLRRDSGRRVGGPRDSGPDRLLCRHLEAESR